MKKTFEFEEGGRTYTCRVEEQRRDRPESWWWVDVSGDRNRYAPFRAESGDSEASVRARIVAFYEDRLKPRVFMSWRDRRAAQKPA